MTDSMCDNTQLNNTVVNLTCCSVNMASMHVLPTAEEPTMMYFSSNVGILRQVILHTAS
jgi:hypothetical protein